MTLIETINIINWAAAKQPNVNAIVNSGDIFDLNKDHFNQKFGAFCCTQLKHRFENDFISYNFVLYYVDRLNEDRSNTIFAQSAGIEVLNNIVQILNKEYLNLDIQISDITTFTEKFAEECAGCYVNIKVTTPKTSICELYLEEVGLGEFAAEPFSDEWFKWLEQKLV